MRDKAFNIAKNPKYDGYQRGTAPMVYKFLIKKTSGKVAALVQSETSLSKTLAARATRNKSTIKNENISNKELAEVLHKPIIKKFDERKIHSPFIDNIFGHRFGRYAIDN